MSNPAQRLAAGLTRLTLRHVPDSLAIALLLTLIVFVAGATVGGASPMACVRLWGDGFWVLLSFGMQMCVILLSGYLIADSALFRRGLQALVRGIASPRSLCLAVAAVSLVLCWLHWGIGLVTASVLAGMVHRQRPDVDLRVLVAAAYLGMGVTWHAGPSGSVPLLLATPGHFLSEQVGLLPVTQTVFTPFNLTMVVVCAGCMLALTAWLYPSEPVAAAAVPPAQAAPEAVAEAEPGDDASLFRRLMDQSRLLNGAVGALGLVWAGQYFLANGLQLTLDSVNLVFVSVAFALHPSPAALARSAAEGARLLHGIVVQFPLYAGMFGIIKGSALSAKLAALFVSVSTPATYCGFVSWYSALLNYFIPSGGSKWAVEAPYLIEAAQRLGVDFGAVAMAYAYGDMASNLIQPFWAIPLLAAAGVRFREVMGYALIFFGAYFVLMSLFVFVGVPLLVLR